MGHLGRLMQALRRTPVLVTLALGGLFVGLYVYASAVPLHSRAPSVLDPTRFKAAQQENLRSGLTDPESAKFRDDFVSAIRSPLVVCGEVNHKQGTGEYIGYQRFIAGPTFKALESAVDADAMWELWPCAPRIFRIHGIIKQWRESYWPDVGCILLAYTLSLAILVPQFGPQPLPTWHVHGDEHSRNLTAAGYWAFFIALPFLNYIWLWLAEDFAVDLLSLPRCSRATRAASYASGSYGRDWLYQ